MGYGLSCQCDEHTYNRARSTERASTNVKNELVAVMASPASPFAISEASNIGIPKAAAAVPVGWRGNAWGNAGEILPVL